MAAPRFDIPQLTPWLEMSFERASGPGGQNVNKVATRATLIFDFRTCRLLIDAERTRIAQRLAGRLTHDGRLRIVSQRARTQAGNRALAEARLLELLESALHIAAPRRPTRPTAGARRRRVEAKRQRGGLKQSRRARASLVE